MYIRQEKPQDYHEIDRLVRTEFETYSRTGTAAATDLRRLTLSKKRASRYGNRNYGETEQKYVMARVLTLKALENKAGTVRIV